MRDNAHVDAAHFDKAVDGSLKVVEGLRLVDVAHVLADIASAVFIGRHGRVHLCAKRENVFVVRYRHCKRNGCVPARHPDKCRLVEHAHYRVVTAVDYPSIVEEEEIDPLSQVCESVINGDNHRLARRVRARHDEWLIYNIKEEVVEAAIGKHYAYVMEIRDFDERAFDALIEDHNGSFV